MKYSSYPLILLFILLGTSCARRQKKVEKEAKLVLKIKTAVAGTADMVDTLQIYGEVKLRQEADLASQFDGRLTGFSLLPGDQVKKGDLLGIIIPPMREALLQSMGKMTRAQKMLVTEEVKEIPLYSPINGVVLEVKRHVGDVVQKGQTIVRIADLKHLDVYGDLPVKYMARVRKTEKLQLSFINFNHKNMMLPVSAFAGKVNPDKQTIGIRLALDNQNGDFRPGMRVILRFPGVLHKNATVIPRRALLEEEGIYSVFVIRGNKAEKRKVNIGIRNNNFVEVLSGLKPGETVATEKAYSLIDGMEVVVR